MEKTYADFDEPGDVKPYFVDGARAYFRRLGGDPDNAMRLAAWAQHWREAQRAMQRSGGSAQIAVEDFGRRGVMVTASGRLIADVFHVYKLGPGGIGRGESHGWFIDKARVAELGIERGTNDAVLLTPALERITGEPVSLVTLRDVAYGPSAKIMQPRMRPIELRSRRELLGLSEAALGVALGELGRRAPIRRDTIHRWEVGREPIPTHVPERLAVIEKITAGFVEKAAADLAAWEGLDDDEGAQAASGQNWATARWTRHVYATASHQAERLPDDQDLQGA